MSRSSVNIVGAGLCGSLLSIILSRRGINASVYERRSDPRSSETDAGRSINLVLSARGIRGLKLAGAFEQVEPLLVPMKGRMIHHEDGSTELQSYGQRKHEIIHSVSRAGLNRALIDTAIDKYNVKVRFQQEAVSYYPEESVLRIRDHEHDQDYDLKGKPLIAADGAGSVIRRAYNGNDRIAPHEELLGHSYKELAIPPGPQGEFQLEPDALHIWPRGEFMLIALPNPGGDFTLTLFMPNEGPSSFAAVKTEDEAEAFFAQYFTDAAELISDLTRSYVRNPVGILGTVRCGRWHDKDKVLLIGDAAHAVVPFHGQGMNLAFEDCVIIDQVLDNPKADWQTVFSVFQEEQIANANAIADMALENYVEMRDTVRDPGYVVRKKLSFELERRLPNRFIPRYSMVMFHDEIPYAVAQARGEIQERLLRALTAKARSIKEIDLDFAESEAEKQLPPLHMKSPAEAGL
ncbi:MAG: NAD(P)/FAD-dependent oxidoreductase [Woeseiaceae bacterium]|nr:NAD(P)/FAD-dependent oxidoreductase [Woeseiaceae bacterium]